MKAFGDEGVCVRWYLKGAGVQKVTIGAILPFFLTVGELLLL